MTKVPLLNPTQDAKLARRMIQIVEEELQKRNDTLLESALDQEGYHRTHGARQALAHAYRQMETLYRREVSK